MKPREALLLFVVAIGVIAMLVASYVFGGYGVPEREVTRLDGDPERGAYMLRVAGCVACHTDAKAGGAFLAGGAPIKTPFGAFVAPNITPDPETGIGGWTAEQFATALTAGVAPDGSYYYPVFPYASYTRMRDQDVADLWAYLKTVPPVSNETAGHDVAFPLGFRPLLAGWQTLFFDPEPFRPDPARSDAWNRGAYLVTGPTHCGECHTPRNALGGPDRDRPLAGSTDGPGGEKVPGLTRDSKDFGTWSRGDLVFALRFGLMPDGDSFSGSMGEVVRDGTSHFTDADRHAIAEYLIPEAPAKP